MPNDNQEPTQKKSPLLIIFIIIILVLLAVILFWWMGKDKNATNTNVTATTNTTAANTNQTSNISRTNTTTNTGTTGAAVDLIARFTFAAQSSDWIEEEWYKPISTAGEVTYGPGGVTFTGLKANSRSGLMTPVEQNVSLYSSLKLHMVVTNSRETLTGTGYNGREAPVAVAVSYLDAAGVEHQGLGEDPTASGQMFWRGFYTLDPTGQSKTTNGVKVQSGQRYTFDFDLMTLNPKPAKIHFVAVEGAGWKERQGTVHELSLVGR